MVVSSNMLMIRLQRVGKKNQAMFRLVLTDKQNGPKSGRFNELLGSYNPHSDEVQFDAEKIKHWISKGAQPSDTVHNLLISQKIIEGKKRNVLGKKTPILKEVPEGEAEVAPVSAEAPKEEASAPEAESSPEPVAQEAKPEEAPVSEEVKEEAPAPVEEKPEAPAEEAK